MNGNCNYIPCQVQCPESMSIFLRGAEEDGQQLAEKKTDLDFVSRSNLQRVRPTEKPERRQVKASDNLAVVKDLD